MAITYIDYTTWGGTHSDTRFNVDLLTLTFGKTTGTYTSEIINISNNEQIESISFLWDQNIDIDINDVVAGNIKAGISISTNGGSTWSGYEYYSGRDSGSKIFTIAGRDLSNARLRFTFTFTKVNSSFFSVYKSGVRIGINEISQINVNSNPPKFDTNITLKDPIILNHENINIEVPENNINIISKAHKIDTITISKGSLGTGSTSSIAPSIVAIRSINVNGNLISTSYESKAPIIVTIRNINSVVPKGNINISTEAPSISPHRNVNNLVPTNNISTEAHNVGIDIGIGISIDSEIFRSEANIKDPSILAIRSIDVNENLIIVNYQAKDPTISTTNNVDNAAPKMNVNVNAKDPLITPHRNINIEASNSNINIISKTPNTGTTTSTNSNLGSGETIFNNPIIITHRNITVNGNLISVSYQPKDPGILSIRNISGVAAKFNANITAEAPSILNHENVNSTVPTNIIFINSKVHGTSIFSSTNYTLGLWETNSKAPNIATHRNVNVNGNLIFITYGSKEPTVEAIKVIDNVVPKITINISAKSPTIIPQRNINKDIPIFSNINIAAKAHNAGIGILIFSNLISKAISFKVPTIFNKKNINELYSGFHAEFNIKNCSVKANTKCNLLSTTFRASSYMLIPKVPQQIFYDEIMDDIEVSFEMIENIEAMFEMIENVEATLETIDNVKVTLEMSENIEANINYYSEVNVS